RHSFPILAPPCGPGFAADAPPPPRLCRNLAPWPSLRFGELHVDEGALAVAAAPAADGVLAGRAAIGKPFYGIEAAEASGIAAAPCVQGAKCRTDRACFAAVRVDHDLRVG